MEAYNNYLIIGGMPECVSSWIKYKDPSKVAQIQNELIQIYENDFSKFKGPLTENFVLQQLCGQYNVAPHYYSERSGEIDFVVQHGTDIIPIEAKGGEDKSAPTFKKYISEHQPKYAVRFSKRGYR